jgi:SNF2 family DNA or RNA helicase
MSSLCSECTFVNEDGRTECEMCNTPLGRGTSHLVRSGSSGVSSANVNRADVALIASACGINETSAMSLLITTQGDVQRAINMHFDLAEATTNKPLSSQQSASQPKVKEQLKKGAKSEKKPVPLPLPPAPVAAVVAPVSKSVSKPVAKRSSATSIPPSMHGVTRPLAKSMPVSSKPSVASSAAAAPLLDLVNDVVRPLPVLNGDSNGAVKSKSGAAGRLVPPTTGAATMMSWQHVYPAQPMKERKLRERVTNYNLYLRSFQAPRSHYVGNVTFTCECNKRRPKKNRDALFMLLRMFPRHGMTTNIKIDGEATHRGAELIMRMLEFSRNCSVELACEIDDQDRHFYHFTLQFWIFVPSELGQSTKLNGGSLIENLNVFKKLQSYGALLPCAFDASRPLPGNVSNTQSAEAVSIADWYKFFTSDVNLPALCATDVELLAKAMPEITLREYQKQAVQWMLSRELGAASLNDILWQRALLPAGAPDGPLEAVYTNSIRSLISLLPPPVARGGILAEEMGLGKTIEVLSLISLNRANDAMLRAPIQRTTSIVRRSMPTGLPLKSTRATLIVTPVTLLGQWKRELLSRFAGGDKPLKVYLYHTNRKRDRAFLIDHDIVLTSYSIIRAEMRRDDMPLHDIYWHRIVLDESHQLKAIGTNLLLSELCHLQARYRWCVSGTPITTLLSDIVQQATFLNMPVHSTAMTRHLNVDARTMGNLLRALVMTHRASQRDVHGEPLVALPRRHAHVVEVELDAKERKLYDWVYKCAFDDMSLLVQGGERLAARFYTRIVSSVLLPPRMVLAHPSALSGLSRVQLGLMHGTPPTDAALAALPRFVAAPAAADGDADEPAAGAASRKRSTPQASAAAASVAESRSPRAVAKRPRTYAENSDDDVDDKVASTSSNRVSGKKRAASSVAKDKKKKNDDKDDDDDSFGVNGDESESEDDVVPDGDDDDDDADDKNGDDDSVDNRAGGDDERKKMAQSAPAGLERVPSPEPVAAAAAAAVPAPAPKLSEQQSKWLALLMEQPECPVCLESIQDAAVTDCNHAFCYECVLSLLAVPEFHLRRCPLCRRAIRDTDIHRIQSDLLAAAPAEGPQAGVRDNEAQQRALALAIQAAETLAVVAASAAPGSKVSVSVRQQQRERASQAVDALRNLLSNARSATSELRNLMALLEKHAESSKLRALLQLIHRIREEDAQAKIVVFSQWSSIVMVISKLLEGLGVGNVQITGDMAMAKRGKNLERFQFDDETPVFLLSLRSGSVGVTLTAANHLIMLEPVLNKATEEQAVNRIFRIGQTRETHIWQMYTKNTIEEKIHQRAMRLDRGLVSGNSGAPADAQAANAAANASNASTNAVSTSAASTADLLIGRVDSASANADTSRSVSIGEVAQLFGLHFQAE